MGQVAGFKLPVASCRLLVAGFRLQDAGVETGSYN